VVRGVNSDRPTTRSISTMKYTNHEEAEHKQVRTTTVTETEQTNRPISTST